MTIYDAYAHCGLRKYEPIETVLANHQRLGISGGVLCQHFGEFDNAYIIDSARRAGPSYCAVALLDSAQPDWRQRLEQIRPDPVLRGVRVRLGDDENWADVIRATGDVGLNVMCYFRVGPDALIDDVAQFAQHYPDSTFVISHLAGSSVGFPSAGAREWSALPNVALQVSGFSMWPSTPEPQIVDLAVELTRAYGPGRSMWGSNFPVSPIDASLELVAKNPFGFSEEEMDQLLSGTARRIWELA
jgi:predicted TIM-barrel fold metal-dependent hydrolase